MFVSECFVRVRGVADGGGAGGGTQWQGEQEHRCLSAPSDGHGCGHVVLLSRTPYQLPTLVTVHCETFMNA